MTFQFHVLAVEHLWQSCSQLLSSCFQIFRNEVQKVGLALPYHNLESVVILFFLTLFIDSLIG